MHGLLEISKKIDLIFPTHPRTRKQLHQDNLLSLLERNKNIHLLEPLPYKEFMKLLFNSKFLITDSGGIQEVTTYLGIPCITLRSNTERPVTITETTNELVNINNMQGKIDQILAGEWKIGSIPEYWDGKTAYRIVSILSNQIDIL